MLIPTLPLFTFRECMGLSSVWLKGHSLVRLNEIWGHLLLGPYPMLVINTMLNSCTHMLKMYAETSAFKTLLKKERHLEL